MAALASEGDASLPTSAIDSRITSTNGSFNSRGESTACAADPRAMQPKPQRAARVSPHLTMRPQLRFVRSPPCIILDAGFGRRLFLAGSSIEGALERRPSRTAFSAAGEECEPTSDVPCRRAASDQRPSATRPEPLLPPPRQGLRLFRIGTPFIDECSLDLHFREGLKREPATVAVCFAAPARLPTLFRSRNANVVELDAAASVGSSPAGARRHAPLFDFCNRNDPQARPSDRRDSPSRNARSVSQTPLSRGDSLASFYRGAKPRVTGQRLC